MKKYTFDEEYTKHVKKHFNMKEGFFDQDMDTSTGPSELKHVVNTKTIYTLLYRYAKANGISGSYAAMLVDNLLEIFYSLVEGGFTSTERSQLKNMMSMMDKRFR